MLCGEVRSLIKKKSTLQEIFQLIPLVLSAINLHYLSSNSRISSPISSWLFEVHVVGPWTVGDDETTKGITEAEFNEKNLALQGSSGDTGV